MSLYICKMVDVCTKYGTSDLPPLLLEDFSRCPHKKPHLRALGCDTSGGCTWTNRRRVVSGVQTWDNTCEEDKLWSGA